MTVKLFQRVIGDSVGLKAEDLENYAELLKLSGFSVSGGRALGVEAFNRIEEELKMSEMTLIAPDWMNKLNRWLVGGMEKGAPYILRSSALSDRGGNGIYESLVFVPIGQEADVEQIWQLERQIYEGEFHQSAIQWREKENLPVGMAIPI
ncbi:MAG: hypothetical protein AAB740_03610, partial [Patescibacteria group bacterium]